MDNYALFILPGKYIVNIEKFTWTLIGKSLSISANTRFTSLSRTGKLSAVIEPRHNSASTSRILKNA